MFTVHTLLVLTVTAVIAAITCALVLAGGASWPVALLSCGGAGGAVLVALPRMINGDDGRDAD
ncbi:hypothetical protein ACFXJ8_31710 [Nonomuraea sp. NPDC059194]|uniref:hypothetical protein n=1 Tax=Nonomuraea sp. NPDC059194 TaxID=3346764 RepID=UPI0036C86650